jgi:serine/threonine-protein kinase
VHRDVSPQNVLVGADGVARVLDFGIAKAERRLNETGDVGRLKGKTGYMAPEHILGDEVDRRADVYAAGIVLWELLVGRRLFEGSDATRMDKALCEPIPRPGTLGGTVPSWMDDIVMCALAREREARFQSAKEMADALESRGAPARPREVAAWVEALAGDRLAERSKLVEQIEAADRAMEPAEPPQTDATVTVTDGNPRRDGSPRRRSLFVAAAIGAVALAAIAVRFGLASRGAPRDPAPATVSAPVALTASEPAPITPASPDTATPPATAPSRPPSRVSGAARHRTAVPSPNCTPPYTVRADGIHVPKPECLGSR